MPRKSYDIFLFFFLGLSHAASSDCHPANKDLYLKYVDSFKCTVYQRKKKARSCGSSTVLHSRTTEPVFPVV